MPCLKKFVWGKKTEIHVAKPIVDADILASWHLGISADVYGSNLEEVKEEAQADFDALKPAYDKAQAQLAKEIEEVQVDKGNTDVAPSGSDLATTRYGTLECTVERAHDLLHKDTETSYSWLFGTIEITSKKSDPYVKVTLGTESFTTRVKEDSPNPVWNQKFTFRKVPLEKISGHWQVRSTTPIRFEVWDEDSGFLTGDDDFLGSETYYLSRPPPGVYRKKGAYRQSVPMGRPFGVELNLGDKTVWESLSSYSTFHQRLSVSMTAIDFGVPDMWTPFELVKAKTECGGAGKYHGYVATLAQCAAKTAPHSRFFIYGTNDNGNNRCNSQGCKCYSEVPGSASCSHVDHTGYNLWKNKKGASPISQLFGALARFRAGPAGRSLRAARRPLHPFGRKGGEAGRGSRKGSKHFTGRVCVLQLKSSPTQYS